MKIPIRIFGEVRSSLEMSLIVALTPLFIVMVSSPGKTSLTYTTVPSAGLRIPVCSGGMVREGLRKNQV